MGFAAGGGAFLNTWGGAVGVPGGKENPGGFVLGAAAGKGLGMFFSNANSFSKLKGPFKTTQLTLLVVTIEFATSGDTYVFSGSAGLGLSLAQFTTTTPEMLTGDKNISSDASCDKPPITPPALTTSPALTATPASPFPPASAVLGGRKDRAQ